MRSYALASTALSSLHPPTAAVPTFPVAPTDPRASAADASSSSRTSSEGSTSALATAAAGSNDGSLLVRTIDDGSVVELSSLDLSRRSHRRSGAGQSTASSCIQDEVVRFALPAPVVGPPSVHVLSKSTVVLCLTTTGFLYRLILPEASCLADWPSWLADGSRVNSGGDDDDGMNGDGQLSGANEGWSTESVIHALQEPSGTEQVTSVVAVDDECVLVGLRSGSLLKLEWQPSSGSWHETSLKPSSVFSFLAVSNVFSSADPFAFGPQAIHSLVALSSSASSSSSSETSYEGPPLAFALSADGRLRAWNVLSGTPSRPLDLVSTGELLAAPPAGPAESGWLRLLGRVPPAAESHAVSDGSSLVVRSGGSSAAAAAGVVDVLAVYLPGRFLLFGVRPSNKPGSPPDLVPLLTVAGPDEDRSSSSALALSSSQAASPTPSASSSGLRAFHLIPSRNGTVRLWSAWSRPPGHQTAVFSLDLIFGHDARSGFAAAVASAATGWREATSLSPPAATASAFAELVLSIEDGHLSAGTMGEPSSSVASPPTTATPEQVAQLFLDHLFYPGRFALSALMTALDSYVSTVLAQSSSSRQMAIGGRLAGGPAALGRSYASLPARIGAIVGCQLERSIDPSTGAVREREHLEACLAEWVGFLARADEAEQRARWALTAVLLQTNANEESTWAIVRRDGLLVPVERSGPAEGAVATGQASASSTTTASTLLSLALDLVGTTNSSGSGGGPGLAVDLAVPYPSLVHVRSDLSRYAAGQGLLGGMSVEDAVFDLWLGRCEPGLSPQTAARLEALGHIHGGLRAVARGAAELLDLIGQTVSHVVSGDDDEEARALSPLGAALTGSAVLESAAARERLALGLVLVLGSVGSQTAEDDPALIDLVRTLDQAVSSWQEAAALEWIAKTGVEVGRSAITIPTALAPAGPAEWVDRFGGLNVGGSSSSSGNQAALLPPPSLLSALLTVESPSHSISLSQTASAILHSWSALDRPGADRSPALGLVSRLLALGQPARAAELADRYDDAEGTGYVKARAALALGQTELSVRLFERVAAVFDLPAEGAPLRTVLPAKVATSWSLVEYYRHVSLVYAPQVHDGAIIRFCNLAIAAAAEEDEAVGPSTVHAVSGMDIDEEEDKENADARGVSGRRLTKDLWSRLFAATLNLGRYEDAYMVLTANPHRDTINDAVSHLITHMCHANQVARLVQFSFVGLQDVVERTLAFKARHSDPMAFPSYPMVLYSWHIHRGDYRSAALAIYAQARRFGEAHGPFAEISARRAKSYLLAINALALVDPRHAWLAMPVAVDPSGKRRKRTKTTANIPDELFSPAARARDVEIVDLADLRREYQLVLSTVTLAERFPNSFHSNILLAEDAVGLFLQAGMIDNAVSTAKKLQVDLGGLVPI